MRVVPGVQRSAGQEESIEKGNRGVRGVPISVRAMGQRRRSLGDCRKRRGKRATSEHIGVRRAPIFVSRRLCGMYRCRDERASGTAVLKGDRIVAQRVTGAVTRVLCRLCLGNGLQSATTAHRRHEQQRRNEQVQNSPGAVHGLQPSYLTET